MSGFLCAIPVLASLLSGCADDGALAVGYVEGEYVNIAPVSAAELVSVDVVKGDVVIPGQLLARQSRPVPDTTKVVRPDSATTSATVPPAIRRP